MCRFNYRNNPLEGDKKGLLGFLQLHKEKRMDNLGQCPPKMNWSTQVVSLLFFILTMAGCGTVQHSLTLTPGYQLKSGTRVDVAEVLNETGENFNVDIQKLLADALTEELRRRSLLWGGEASPHIKVTSKIVDYKPGNAFQRWLLPGWGSTVLTVHGELWEGGNVIGSAEARRTVSIGGGYTIGAWRTIFTSLAKDIVGDLRKKMLK